MTGAIEFMKAWQEICNERNSCDDCPISESCLYYGCLMSDEQIAELVRQVMAEARKKEARKK